MIGRIGKALRKSPLPPATPFPGLMSAWETVRQTIPTMWFVLTLGLSLDASGSRALVPGRAALSTPIQPFKPPPVLRGAGG